MSSNNHQQLHLGVLKIRSSGFICFLIVTPTRKKQHFNKHVSSASLDSQSVRLNIDGTCMVEACRKGLAFWTLNTVCIPWWQNSLQPLGRWQNSLSSLVKSCIETGTDANIKHYTNEVGEPENMYIV